MSAAGPLPGAHDARPRRNLAIYQQLITQGLAEADRRGGAVDHVTARRMSLLLTSQTPDPQFARSLSRFAGDGAITQDLKERLRHYARSPGHQHQPHAARLLDYTVARGPDAGPVGTNFAAACDDADRADIRLAELRSRNAKPGIPYLPYQGQPRRQQPTAIDPREPASGSADHQMVRGATANGASVASAPDREAHTAAMWPELDPSELAPPDSQWPEPEWPEPEWPGAAPGQGRHTYAFVLAASPWYKERYPDKAANLWDALAAGQPHDRGVDPEFDLEAEP
jgi:hypothetical protein